MPVASAVPTRSSCPSTYALLADRKNRRVASTDGWPTSTSSVSTIPLDVDPPRSSLPSERTTASTPCRVAATAGESSAAGARETVTTRPLPARERSTEPTARTGSVTAVGSAASVRTTTTAPQRTSSWWSRRTSRSQPRSVRATASASALEAASARTSTGPTVSGSPSRYRRRIAGRGRPSFLARVLVNPEFTAWA
jgi:hypothetical protein